jgi:hypothetical protein
MTEEELKEIKKNLECTTSKEFIYKGFDVLGEDEKSILNVNRHVDGSSEAEFGNIGDAEFFVNARRDIPKLLEEIDGLKTELNKRDRDIGGLEFQIEQHIKVEERRRDEFKQLHDLLKDYEIPTYGPTRYDKHAEYSPVTRFQLLIERVSDCVAIQNEDKEERQDKLLIIFNKLLKIIPLDYVELNYKFIVEDDKKDLLLKLEKEFPELGLIQPTKDGKHGVSVLSLFATITDVFCNKRLAFELNEERDFTRVTYYFFNDKDKWVEDTPINRVPSFISDHKFGDEK